MADVLRNHREAIAAMHFFAVPKLTFGVMYCLFVISHDPAWMGVVYKAELIFSRSRLLSQPRPSWAVSERETNLWLANCYGRADFTGNSAAQVNWVSLSQRIRRQ